MMKPFEDALEREIEHAVKEFVRDGDLHVLIDAKGQLVVTFTTPHPIEAINAWPLWYLIMEIVSDVRPGPVNDWDENPRDPRFFFEPPPPEADDPDRDKTERHNRLARLCQALARAWVQWEDEEAKRS
jgi:hypothetical protein